MFERYTEAARRALFFARYELSALGGATIQPEHLLLGLLRDSKTKAGAMLSECSVPLADLRQQLEAHAGGGDRFATSIEVPFSPSAKRVLNFAAEEADRLLHYAIEPHHLLLALMREPDSFAATSLTQYGLTLNGVREYIVKHPATERPPSENVNAQSEHAGARALISIHIQEIMELVRDLEQAAPNTTAARDLVERIHDELMMLEELGNG